jgi:hypothetical protein
MKKEEEQDLPRKKPFVRPEVRAVRYEPGEVTLGGCKAMHGGGPNNPGTCRLCGSRTAS